MVENMTFMMLSLGILILALWVRSLDKKLEAAQQIIGHMLLGTIQGAEVAQDGEVVIVYKEDDSDGLQ